MEWLERCLLWDLLSMKRALKSALSYLATYVVGKVGVHDNDKVAGAAFKAVYVGSAAMRGHAVKIIS